MTRSLALGPDWREIGQRNMENREARINGATERTSYAGGLLQGNFYERGCSNITGSISVFDLYNDEWYALGSSGSLWKGSLTGSTWTLLTKKTLFQNRCLKVINNGGTKRILATYNGDIRYSDNDGSTWTDVNIPTYNNGNAAANSIYVSGGTEENDGSNESYLLKLNGGNTVTATQYAYDFRANNGGTGWIAAVENSPVNTNYLFVASSTGKFFYSWDGGSNWTKHPTLTGPSAGWLFGSFIYASRLNANKLWYCGAGGKVYQSVDGGVNFTTMTNGMPNTFITELAANAAETVLFAATDAGPYAYVFQTGQWYALADATTPIVEFSSVEHIAASNLMRFSTQGRGIWDFQITAAPALPIELAGFDGKLDKNSDVQLLWKTASEWNAERFDIERGADGLVFEKIGQVGAQNRAADYRFTDFLPRNGLNYYRLRQFDHDGANTFSPTVAIEVKGGQVVGISPNPAVAGGDVFVENSKEGQVIRLFDNSGRLVFRQAIGDDGRALLEGVPPAAYFFEIKDGDGKPAGSGKLLVK